MIDTKNSNHSGVLRNMASVYLRRGDRILLLYRQGNSIVRDLWIGSAGGHFEKDEVNNAKNCVLRELHEELGLSEDHLSELSLRYVTIRYADGELRQNYYFFANISNCDVTCPTSNEGITRWYALNELSNLPMPFTARFMIDHYILEGQYNNILYGGIANQDGVTFTPL